jgi:putative phosphoesterase
MRILVFSDTHGNYVTQMASLAEAEPVDLIVHLGDETNDAEFLGKMTAIPVIRVQGNCDHALKVPREICKSIAGHRIFITHGDRYRVKNGLTLLIDKAVSERAGLVLFGHTHSALILKERGILLVNPGALMSQGSIQSYAVVTLTGNEITAEIFLVELQNQQPQPQL